MGDDGREIEALTMTRCHCWSTKSRVVYWLRCCRSMRGRSCSGRIQGSWRRWRWLAHTLSDRCWCVYFRQFGNMLLFLNNPRCWTCPTYQSFRAHSVSCSSSSHSQHLIFSITHALKQYSMLGSSRRFLSWSYWATHLNEPMTMDKT